MLPWGVSQVEESFWEVLEVLGGSKSRTRGSTNGVVSIYLKPFVM